MGVSERQQWVAFFSQTGSEILEISRKLGRLPDKVIYNTNYGKLAPINPELIEVLKTVNQFIVILPNRPEVFNYDTVLQDNDIVTLNGWLRIMPPSVCKQYEIYNGHPGLITKYPDLKGQDPQKKAIALKLETSGCVIHKVTAEVDAGEILKSVEVPIQGLDIDQVISTLHNTSIDLWVEFLKEKLNANSY